MSWDWKTDLEANSHRRGRSGAFKAFLLDPSFTFVVWLRCFFYLKPKQNKIVRLLTSMIFLHIYRTFSTYISFDAQCVGVGLKVPHPHGIVIGRRMVIGNHVTVLQNVTLGRKDVKGEPDRSTVIGDGVVVSAGAVVLGPVDIGKNVVIGANAVVLKNLPDGAVAVGIPAKIIKVLP